MPADFGRTRRSSPLGRIKVAARGRSPKDKAEKLRAFDTTLDLMWDDVVFEDGGKTVLCLITAHKARGRERQAERTEDALPERTPVKATGGAGLPAGRWAPDPKPNPHDRKKTETVNKATGNEHGAKHEARKQGGIEAESAEDANLRAEKEAQMVLEKEAGEEAQMMVEKEAEKQRASKLLDHCLARTRATTNKKQTRPTTGA